MDDSIVKGMGGKNWEYSALRYLHYMGSGIVLFGDGLRLIKNDD